MMRRKRWILPLLVAAFTVAACSSGGDGKARLTEPGDTTEVGDTTATGSRGSFTGTVTGAVGGSFKGFSLFAVADTTGGKLFVLQLGDTTNIPTGLYIMVFGWGRARPGAGTYAVGDPTPDTLHILVYMAGATQAFSSESGTLTITASSAERIEGTLRFVARDAADDDRTITVDASFRAVCAATVTGGTGRCS